MGWAASWSSLYSTSSSRLAGTALATQTADWAGGRSVRRNLSQSSRESAGEQAAVSLSQDLLVAKMKAERL